MLSSRPTMYPDPPPWPDMSKASRQGDVYIRCIPLLLTTRLPCLSACPQFAPTCLEYPVNAFHLPHQSFHIEPLNCPYLPSIPAIPSTHSPYLTKPPISSPDDISSMATTALCQPSSGDTIPYVLITTRILAIVGFSWLLKSLYQLTEWPLFSHRSPREIPDG